MKTWKLVSGILSIVFFPLISLQSCAAGFVDAVEAEGGSSGASGTFVAMFMLAGGIVSIATRKSEKKGGNIALIILFGLGALLGFSAEGAFGDLVIWSSWCLLAAVLALVDNIKNKH